MLAGSLNARHTPDAQKFLLPVPQLSTLPVIPYPQQQVPVGRSAAPPDKLGRLSSGLHRRKWRTSRGQQASQPASQPLTPPPPHTHACTHACSVCVGAHHTQPPTTPTHTPRAQPPTNLVDTALLSRSCVRWGRLAGQGWVPWPWGISDWETS